MQNNTYKFIWQSLYALVSRMMSFAHTKIGRHKGVCGFIINDILTKTEQVNWQLICDVTRAFFIVHKLIILLFPTSGKIINEFGYFN